MVWVVCEMNTSTIATFLAKQLDQWDRRIAPWDQATYRMDDYRQTSELLGACGHDTRELEKAIIDARVVLDRLVAARNKAVARFKAEGVIFVVDESNRKRCRGTCDCREWRDRGTCGCRDVA